MTPIQATGWETLEQRCLACTGCPLATTRQQVVFGTGQRDAEILLVGEGPGANEDAQGEPFVGLAGQLLDRMLAGVGLSRQKNVYIANIVKCRPPHNRDPLPGGAGVLHRLAAPADSAAAAAHPGVPWPGGRLPHHGSGIQGHAAARPVHPEGRRVDDGHTASGSHPAQSGRRKPMPSAIWSGCGIRLPRYVSTPPCGSGRINASGHVWRPPAPATPEAPPQTPRAGAG